MAATDQFLKDLGFSDEWIAQLSSKDKFCVFQEQQAMYDFAPVTTEDVSDLVIDSDDSPFNSDLVL